MFSNLLSRPPRVLCRAGQYKPKADDRVASHPDRSRVWQASEGRDGHAGRVQAASQDVEQDEGPEDAKEWKDERSVPEPEHPADDQSPPATSAEADGWHGRPAGSHEANGRQGHEQNAQWHGHGWGLIWQV